MEDPVYEATRRVPERPVMTATSVTTEDRYTGYAPSILLSMTIKRSSHYRLGHEDMTVVLTMGDARRLVKQLQELVLCE
jgi:hypothetical protein